MGRNSGAFGVLLDEQSTCNQKLWAFGKFALACYLTTQTLCFCHGLYSLRDENHEDVRNFAEYVDDNSGLGAKVAILGYRTAAELVIRNTRLVYTDGSLRVA